jgi:hypothetical protein
MQYLHFCLGDKCAGGEFLNVMHLLLQNSKEKSEIAPNTPACYASKLTILIVSIFCRVLQLTAVPS